MVDIGKPIYPEYWNMVATLNTVIFMVINLLSKGKTK
jgi:hypothetical protein